MPLPTAAELKTGFANHPGSIATELLNWTMQRKGQSLGEIRRKASEFAAILDIINKEPRHALELFAKPVDVVNTRDSEQTILGSTEGRQALFMSALITDTMFPTKLTEWAGNPDNREAVRHLFNKALLHDYATLQAQADETTGNNDLILAGALQDHANKMLELQTKLMAKVKPTEGAPAANQ